MPVSGERVLVTGAAGFIGHHVCRELLAHGHCVRGLVRSPDRAEVLPPFVEAVVGDLGADFPRAALDGVTSIIHLAARAHVMHERGNAVEVRYRNSNVRTTQILVERARDVGVRRFVFVSSVKVHGKGGLAPTKASDPLTPLDAYGRSKAEGENVVATQSGAMEWTVVRPTFVYGRGGKGNFERLIRLTALATRVPLPLDSIKNRRSIIYVENLAALLRVCSVHPAARGRAYIAADPEAPSTPQLIRGLGAALGVRPRLFSCPVALLRFGCRLLGGGAEVARLTDSFVVDTSPARIELGWESSIPLDVGLRHAVGKSRHA